MEAALGRENPSELHTYILDPSQVQTQACRCPARAHHSLCAAMETMEAAPPPRTLQGSAGAAPLLPTSLR